MEQGAEGLKIFDGWKSDEKAVDAYREAAAKKWPEATAFKKKSG